MGVMGWGDVEKHTRQILTQLLVGAREASQSGWLDMTGKTHTLRSKKIHIVKTVFFHLCVIISFKHWFYRKQEK